MTYKISKARMAEIKRVAAQLQPLARTQWFPATTRPARPGVYERPGTNNAGVIFFSYWCGDMWHGLWGTPEQAAKRSGCLPIDELTAPWRGLTTERGL